MKTALQRRIAASRQYQERCANAATFRLKRLFEDIADCDALWAIDWRAPDAYARLLSTVPVYIRHACFDLPMKYDPIARALGPGPHTFAVIAEAYGLTRSRIEQVEKAALHSARCECAGMSPNFQDAQPSPWDLMGLYHDPGGRTVGRVRDQMGRLT